MLRRGVQMVTRRVQTLKKRRSRAAVIPSAAVIGAALGIALDELIICLAVSVAIGVVIYLLPKE